MQGAAGPTKRFLSAATDSRTRTSRADDSDVARCAPPAAPPPLSCPVFPLSELVTSSRGAGGAVCRVRVASLSFARLVPSKTHPAFARPKNERGHHNARNEARPSTTRERSSSHLLAASNRRSSAACACRMQEKTSQRLVACVSTFELYDHEVERLMRMYASNKANRARVATLPFFVSAASTAAPISCWATPGSVESGRSSRSAS